jgi:PAS domain S-box-containing protein
MSDGTARRQLPSVEMMALAALGALPEASVMVFDRELRYVIVRGPALAVHGFSTEAVEGQLAFEALSEERWALYEPSYRRALQGETSSIEVRSVDESRWYLIGVGPLVRGDGEVIGGVSFAVDITRRKRAEEAVVAEQHLGERTAARLAAIVRGSDDAIVSESLEGTILTVNPSAERVYGYSAEELVGKPISVLAPEDRVAEPAEILDAVGRSGRVATRQTRGVRKDGSEINVSLTVSPIVDAAGKIVAAFWIVRDITAEVVLRRQIEAERAYNRGLIESAADGLVTIDRQGVISDVNEAMCRLAGHPRERLIGSEFASHCVDPGGPHHVLEPRGRGDVRS